MSDDDKDFIKQVAYVCDQWRGLTVAEVIMILELEDQSRQFPIALGMIVNGSDIVEDLDKHFSQVQSNSTKLKH